MVNRQACGSTEPLDQIARGARGLAERCVPVRGAQTRDANFRRMKSEDEREGIIHFTKRRSDGNIGVDPNCCRMGTAGQAEGGNEDAKFGHSRIYPLQTAKRHSKIRNPPGTSGNPNQSSAAMTSAELDAANRSVRAVLMLITFVSLGTLSGCGGGWQPDPRDMPHDQMKSDIEGSGLNGPVMEDSRTHL